MQKHPSSSQTLAKIQHKMEIEPETFKRPLPTWCRGIMGGCVNCGGCV